MGIKAEKAKELFRQGYNCSQAVFGSFYEDINMDFETAVRLASAFGGGMGRPREIRGASALSSWLQVSNTAVHRLQIKRRKPRTISEFSILPNDARQKGEPLRELLKLDAKTDSFIPADRTQEYDNTRPCEAMIGEAAEILEECCKSPLTQKMKSRFFESTSEIFYQSKYAFCRARFIHTVFLKKSFLNFICLFAEIFYIKTRAC